jgi:hypothetical protein
LPPRRKVRKVSKVRAADLNGVPGIPAGFGN